MKHSYLLLTAVALALSPALDACALDSDYVGDLMLVSVQKIPPNDPRLDIGFGNRSIFPNRTVLEVTLSTRADIVNIVTTEDYNFENKTSLCSQGKYDPTRQISNHPSVFDEDGEVNAYRAGHNPGKGAIEGYRIFIATREARASDPGFINYDLEKEPADICVEFWGGKMIGGHLHSNTVVIQSAAIEKALSDGAKP